MTPYEIIMVVLTFLSLLIAVDAKNRKYKANRRSALPLIGGLSLFRFQNERENRLRTAPRLSIF